MCQVSVSVARDVPARHRPPLMTLMTLQGEEFAAMRKGGSVSARFAERIRVAKAADTEACRAYHQHVNEHGCV
jgi:hypothetical protein